MIARTGKLISWSWVASVTGAAFFVAAVATMVTMATIVSSCGQRSLVELDVFGDAPFQSVTLSLSANGGSTKTFSNATFAPAMPFKAGLYLPDSVSGDVTIVGKVVDGTGACIGIGQVVAPGVAAGNATNAITLNVAHTSDCAVALPGAGGATGSGSGGGTGAGGEGAGAGTGAGGATGSGAGGSNGGSAGGATGTGGATGSGGATGGPNLITNGDFADGQTGWGVPAMVGPVTQAITNGAFCVTLSGVSATIGYPSGATPPFQIASGMSYRFSYQASVSSGGMMFEAKVGQTMPPYDGTGSDFMNEPAGASLQTFTHTFTRATTDSSMGIGFNITGGPGTACVDNVSLTTN